MNIKQERHAPLRIQFEQGYKAFINKWLFNQYNPSSMMGKEWQRGFDKAYFDNLDLVKRGISITDNASAF